ncbi:MAG: LysM peptidoglycan-binding domain-containing protein [Deltaproteobacteria bacterium]|nr:LysM peptidoglycan-binding domain-containing protein [Deltaproteobacteria bacterium]
MLFFVILMTISGYVVAGEPVRAAAPPVSPSGPTPQPVASGATLPFTAAVPSKLLPEPVPVLSAPPAEKQSDRVLSPGEVDMQVTENREEEREEEPAKDFFTSVQSDEARKENGFYSGLAGRIEKFIRYFQTAGRSKFEVYLSRSGKYSDMMREILSKYGLPGDLIYLALIESGFSPKAYSVARAAGPWQFIAGTARRYGLRIDWWTDERRDYEKSTHAAASYLKELYGMFDSWPLAAAAYNAGEGKIQRAVARYRSDDYVQLIRHRYLAQETKDYVPKMIAALSIAKEPEKYGFSDVQYESPLEFDKVVVPGGTGLAALGRIIGVPYDSLREWNPELKRFCTPPNRETYELRLPKGYGEIAEERMEGIRTDAKVTFLLHSVKKGESLDSLANRYQTSVSVLQELNGLKGRRVGRSARLVIPVTGLSDDEAVPGKEVSPEQVEAALSRLDEGGRRTRTVRVRKGDTLSGVSARTGVPVKEIARANGLKSNSRLRVGTGLRLPGAGKVASSKPAAGFRSGKKAVRHIVRRGETLEKIAKAYGVTPEQLTERNNLNPGQVLPRGRVLVIPVES